MARYGTQGGEQAVSVPRPKAGQIQTPPPEEAEAKPSAANPTEQAALRLAGAYRRAVHRRNVQVDGRTSPIATLQDSAKPVFWELARWCINNQIANFEGYIAAQFAYSVPRHLDDQTIGCAPNVSSYKSAQALDRWTIYDRRIVSDLKHEFEANCLEFECRTSEARITFPEYTDRQLWKFVLMNNFIALSPLFQYCIAISEQLPEPAEEYHISALHQFLTDPISYVRAWATAIPFALRTEAERFILVKLPEVA